MQPATDVADAPPLIHLLWRVGGPQPTEILITGEFKAAGRIKTLRGLPSLDRTLRFKVIPRITGVTSFHL